MTSDYARAFAAAVAREINAEMGRQGIDSKHEMARRVGTNHVSVNNRLNLHPRSGRKPVVINMEDLATYCRVLNVEPAEIVRLAQNAVDVRILASRPASTHTTMVAAREQRNAEMANPEASQDVSQGDTST